MTVAEFATKRVVSTTMILIFMVFSGFMTMRSMKKELIPDFKFPMVVISTSWTGAASEDVKTQISKKAFSSISYLPLYSILPTISITALCHL